MKKILLALLLSVTPAAAQQSVTQSGFVTPGHVPMWTFNGVIQDGGTAAQGFLNSLGVTATGPGICQNSGPTTGPYNQLCLQATATGAGLSLFNFGGATGSFTLNYNGVNQGFGLVTLPTTPGDLGCFINSTGGFYDCGVIAAQVPRLNTLNTFTNTDRFTGTLNVLGTFQYNNNNIIFPANSAVLTYQVGGFINGHCLQASGTAGGVVDSGAACGGSGGGTGTVTSITFNNFLTGGNITTSGTVGAAYLGGSLAASVGAL